MAPPRKDWRWQLAGMNRGVSLLEVIIVLAVLATLAGVLAPKLQRERDRAAVSRAVAEFQARHSAARMRAVALGRVTLFRLSPGAMSLRVLAGGDTVARREWPGPGSHGVSLTGPTGWLRFVPPGMGLGLSNGSWTFTRGNASRTVVASRSGRLRTM